MADKIPNLQLQRWREQHKLTRDQLAQLINQYRDPVTWHLIIGLPANLDDMTGTPGWVDWVGCLHPGYDRRCDECGLAWSHV